MTPRLPVTPKVFSRAGGLLAIVLSFYLALSANAAPAQFSANDLPAGRDGAALLTIPTPGRYSIRAKSASGARIELIDMIAGPGEASGAAGLRDGRIDALLDKGVYKLRVYGAKGANGTVKLSAEAFVEADAKRATLSSGQIASAELGDLQQRSFVLDVDASGRVNVEAAGRALRDLRLWRADGELVDLIPQTSVIEPKPGHYLTSARLEGSLPPGHYTLTAYGGEKLVWADGATAQPLILRIDAPQPLSAGVAEGVIGPFGALRFEAPAAYDAFRLELSKQAAARIDASRTGARATAEIGKTSRDPVATVELAANGKQPARLEVSGLEGQVFSLRAFKRDNRLAISATGPHLVTIDVAGEGGDEIPATALFARIENDKMRVLASDLPRVATTRPWRAKFNLRGTTSLLLEATNDGPVAVDVKGPKTKTMIEPVFGSLAPRADGRDPTRYDLQAGFYLLTLEPVGDAAGVVDVTLGAPGLAAPPPPPAPTRTVISFGGQKLEKDGSYLLIANVAPALITGPRVVALPVDLEKAPLALWQSGGAALSLPARVPKTGKIVARDARGADVAATLADEKIENDDRFVTVKIAPSGRDRALGLVYLPEETKGETPAKDGEPAKPSRAAPVATIDKPTFFNLGRDETKEVRFNLAQGGLYRIETLGRLQTALAVGTNFSPRVGEGENNGPGHNGLVTTYLRAGGWRAAVTAKESSGHLGLSVTPSALVATAKLTDSGTARATLDAGKGAIVPFEITRDGVYRLDLLGVALQWRARLEDSEGWPLTAPGKLDHLERQFEKGSYRLVVMPEDVEARMLMRLAPVVSPPALEGHGPHVLPFNSARTLQWREPQTKDAPRAPDVWRFSLQGDANVDLRIGDGMAGEIFHGANESLGRVLGDHPFKGKLAAGDYRIEARSVAHDDRLDYTLTLNARELQPEAPRFVNLPATLAFSIAADRIVELTSFGDKELLGLLKDANGAVIERLQGRADDWNIALSRRLPAGAYTLQLLAPGAAPEASEEQSDEEGANTAAGEAADGGIEIRLALPAEVNDGALPAQGAKTLSGDSAHTLILAAAPSSGLALVAARSDREVALSIERREAGGAWRVVGADRGVAPVVAWPPAGDDKGEWRAVVWPVGGGSAAIAVASRVIERRAQSLGEVTLDPVEGIAAPVCVGLVAVPAASLIETRAPAAGLLAGSTPGRVLRAARSGTLAPQSESLWLLSRGDCKERVGVAGFEWKGADVAIDIDAGESAELPKANIPSGKARLLLARSAFGQPGVDAGRGVAVAGGATLGSAAQNISGAALALVGDGRARLWNAGGAAPLRSVLRAIDVTVSPPAHSDRVFAGVIAPMSAQPVMTDAADAPLAFDLAPGLAAFSAPDEARPFAIFGDETSVARMVNNAAKNIWIVNLSDKPAPARVEVLPGKPEALSSTRALKRFFGAGGEIALRVEAEKGDRLVSVGGDASFISDKGLVMRGASLTLDGPGEAVIAYRPGLVAAWIERAGKGPWRVSAPRAVSLPQRVTMEGAAMTLSFRQTAPAMIDVKSTAPAIVAFTQGGRREIVAYGSGVELHRYATAGEATLEVYSPHDGALAGMLDISAQPVIAAHEGINDEIALSPGASALFSFKTTREGDVGYGVRAEPDRVAARLLDETGKTLAEGLAQSLRLAPGRYLVEARAPTDAPAMSVRLAILGVSPPPASPPDDEVAKFLELAGLKKAKGR